MKRKARRWKQWGLVSQWRQEQIVDVYPTLSGAERDRLHDSEIIPVEVVEILPKRGRGK